MLGIGTDIHLGATSVGLVDVERSISLCFGGIASPVRNGCTSAFSASLICCCVARTLDGSVERISHHEPLQLRTISPSSWSTEICHQERIPCKGVNINEVCKTRVAGTQSRRNIWGSVQKTTFWETTGSNCGVLSSWWVTETTQVLVGSALESEPIRKNTLRSTNIASAQRRLSGDVFGITGIATILRRRCCWG